MHILRRQIGLFVKFVKEIVNVFKFLKLVGD